jgi:hypothetical protein
VEKMFQGKDLEAVVLGSVEDGFLPANRFR